MKLQDILGAKTTQEFKLWIPNVSMSCKSYEEALELGQRMKDQGKINRFSVIVETTTTIVTEITSH